MRTKELKQQLKDDVSPLRTSTDPYNTATLVLFSLPIIALLCLWSPFCIVNEYL